MLKAAVLVVLALLLATMIGRAIRPQVPRDRQGPRIETASKCPSCGAYRVGGGACERADCPARGRG